MPEDQTLQSKSSKLCPASSIIRPCFHTIAAAIGLGNEDLGQSESLRLKTTPCNERVWGDKATSENGSDFATILMAILQVPAWTMKIFAMIVVLDLSVTLVLSLGI